MKSVFFVIENCGVSQPSSVSSNGQKYDIATFIFILKRTMSIPNLESKVASYFENHVRNIFEIAELTIELVDSYFKHEKNKREKQKEIYKQISKEVIKLFPESERKDIGDVFTLADSDICAILDYVEELGQTGCLSCFAKLKKKF